jgi:hypothetical protein
MIYEIIPLTLDGLVLPSFTHQKGNATVNIPAHKSFPFC